MSTTFIFSTLSPLSSALCVLVLEEQKLMVHCVVTHFWVPHKKMKKNTKKYT
jgi:hypothetical protein